MDCSLLCPWKSPGKNSRMGCHSLFQGIFPTRDWTRSPALQADSLLSEPSGKPKNTGVGSLSLLQGTFPTQGLNPGVLHCSQILYQLSYWESPFVSWGHHNEGHVILKAKSKMLQHILKIICITTLEFPKIVVLSEVRTGFSFFWKFSAEKQCHYFQEDVHIHKYVDQFLWKFALKDHLRSYHLFIMMTIMMIINNNSNHYLSLNIRHHVKYLTYIASLIPTEGLLRFWKRKSHYFYAHFRRTKNIKKKRESLNLAIP